MTVAPGRRRRLTAEAVRLRRFTPVRLRGGYDMPEVDAFLEHVRGELVRCSAERGVGCPGCADRMPDVVRRLTSDDVQTVRFTPVRVREGYAMDEVDLFLDDVQVELDRRALENRRACPQCD